MKNNYFPVFIRMDERKILLYGGGNIALRRVRGLLDFGASVTVCAPVICQEILELSRQYPDRVHLKWRCYQPGEIAQICGQDSAHTDPGVPVFVLSATSDAKADVQIWKECKSLGIPVNVASDQTMCDFQFPALIRQDDIVIGVNSGGKDHRKVRLIAAKLRSWIREHGGIDESD